jgi:hypothetical protein
MVKISFPLLNYLEFVEVLFDIWETLLETLSLSDLVEHLSGLGLSVSWIAAQHLPMVEDALWESLTASVRTQVSSEALRKKRKH